MASSDHVAVKVEVADLEEVKAAFDRAEATIGKQTSSLRKHRLVLARKCDVLIMSKLTLIMVLLLAISENVEPVFVLWALVGLSLAGIFVAWLDRREYLRPVENPIEVLAAQADPTRPPPDKLRKAA